MESKVATYVRTRAKKALKENREKYIHNSVLVYVKDKMPVNFDLDEVLFELERTIPVELFHEVDSIYIGQFKEINDRDLESVYKDGSIYTTNVQTSEQSMYETIVHELAHALEEVYGLDLYMDDLLEREFLGKRKKLFDILKSNGYNIGIRPFQNPGYSVKFDEFLYKEVGYPTLTTLTMGLFVSPYGATSLREYFANGFEEYYTGDRESVRRISPQLYNKIYSLTER